MTFRKYADNERVSQNQNTVYATEKLIGYQRTIPILSKKNSSVHMHA